MTRAATRGREEPGRIYQSSENDRLDSDFRAPPDVRGFDGNRRIYTCDPRGRPVAVEGWADSREGPGLAPSDRDRVCGLVRDGLHTAHLFSQSLGGDKVRNLVPLPAEHNAVSSHIERDIAQRVRGGEPLYIQAHAFYREHDLRIPSEIEVKVWRRDPDGKPAFVTGYRVDDGGLRHYH